jgi:hypothetical protein
MWIVRFEKDLEKRDKGRHFKAIIELLKKSIIFPCELSVSSFI